jgi:hypothetical protein
VNAKLQNELSVVVRPEVAVGALAVSALAVGALAVAALADMHELKPPCLQSTSLSFSLSFFSFTT